MITAGVHPDRDRGWLHRLAPIVAAHRRLLIVSLVAALGAMLAQVAVPAVIRQAIDRALVDGGAADLQPLVVLMVALGVARALLTLAYRYGLYRMAFEIDADLRTLLTTT